MAEKIISKGTYSHPGVPNFVTAKQYIVVQKGKKRHLFLRFENPKNDTLTAISFSVDLLDSSGMVIGHTKIEKKNLSVKACSGFSINKSVVMVDGCADFKVTVHSASYGDYRYVTHGDEVQVLYEKQKEDGEYDNVPFLKRLGGAVHKAAVKSLSAPGFFFTLVSIILLAFALIVGMKVYDFTRTEVCFTLDKVEYTFATDDRKNGPIIIIGYKSNASNVIIPDSIEGHDVVAVEADAFADSNIRTIKFEGKIEIRAHAFINCTKLESVSINSTESIGENAFYNCTNLMYVTVKNDLKSIEKNAFGNCQSLVDISIPDTLTSVEDYVFYNCSSLESLTLPDSMEHVGQKILSNCTSLNTLKLPYLGENPESKETLSYLFSTKAPASLKNLTLTKTNVISKDMFRDEKNIESITFTDRVTTVGTHAFDGCSSLISVDLPSSITTIGEYAFADCISLKKFVVPDKVTDLKEAVFTGCKSLEEITLPANLVKISNYALSECSSLKSLVIPTSVNFIGRNALKNCTGMTSLTVPYLANEKGGIPISLKELIFGDQYNIYYGSDSNLKELVILSGTSIPNYAFFGFTHLETVVLPTELESISVGCFMQCESLTEVSMPQTLSSIGASAFSNCYSLRSIAIPAGVSTVAIGTFDGCSSLESVVLHNNILAIENEAFKDCASLSYIQIPSNITTLATSVFENCSSLDNVVLPERLTKIGTSAFSGCSSLSSISFPETLTEISNYAFYGCSSISSIDITANIATIGERAFSGCSSLMSFTLPETVISVGYSILENCTSLERLTAPFPNKFVYDTAFSYYFYYSYGSSFPEALQSVTITSARDNSLPSNAFSDCTNILSLSLPENLKTIGQHAFKNCASLTSLVIPDSVSYMGIGMLYGTTSLSDLTLPYAGLDSSSYYGFSYFYCYDNYAYGYPSIPQNLKKVTLTKATSIPAGAFSNFSSIEEINLPDTLQSIGESAFSNCLAIKNVTIPESVTSVYSNAFSGCYRLYEVRNNSNVANIQSAFPHAIKIYTNGETTIGTKITTQGYTFLYGSYNNSENQWYLTNYDSSLVTLLLPSGVSNSGTDISYALPDYIFYSTPIQSVSIPGCVTSIGKYAFKICNKLTTVSFSSGSQIKCVGTEAFTGSSISGISFPASLEIIEESAFYNCTALTSLTFASGSRLKEIKPYAFAQTAISSVDFPAALETIGNQAFYYCTNLGTVTFASRSALSTIGTSAFSETAIKSLTIPSSLATIGESAFSNCYSLTEVSFEANSALKNISYYTFYNTAIKSIEIPASIENIYDYAFYECKSLSSLTFAATSALKTIGNYSFYYAPIKSLSIPANVETIGTSAFYECRTLTSLTFVPDGKLRYIGSYAFQGAQITSLSLPAALETIEYCAFAYCQSLSSIAIRNASTYNINYAAFEGCGTIYEVYDLAGIGLTPGSGAWNGIARDALIVHTNASAESLRDVTVDGFLFKKSGSNWFLMGLEAGNKTTTLNLDSFTYNGSKVNSFVINKNAFVDKTDITDVTIGKAVTKIGEYAFYNCSSLKTLTFAQDSPLTEISNSAFGYCTSLKSVSIPKNVTTINSYAFNSCSALETVTLPESLQNIYYSAFDNCYALYDVMNLSSTLQISAGSFDYGNVAYYALAVRKSDTPLETTVVSDTNADVKFAKHNGTWYLISLKTKNNYTRIEFPDLTVDSKKCNYKVFRYALNSVYIYNTAVVVSANVTAMDYNILSQLYYVTLYFKGTDDDFKSIISASEYGNYYGSVRYYAECIHEDNEWNYDANDKINTAKTELTKTVTKEPTCMETGIETHTCPICKKAETFELPVSNVHDLKDGKCNVCKKEVTVVTKDNFATIDIITNDEVYAFTIDDKGVIKSTTQKKDSTSSTLQITATEKITISFSYTVSSESGCDILSIIAAGTSIDYISGTNNSYKSYTVTLEKGESLTFTYSKDGSAFNGDDCAYIKDITITKES